MTSRCVKSGVPYQGMCAFNESMASTFAVQATFMSERWLLQIILFAIFFITNAFQATAQSLGGQQTILFGAAYYEEYAPSDRLDEDVRMVKATGITVVRIAESTWGTLEPKPGVFDFSHVDQGSTSRC